jgi:hypothetical protein
MGELIKNRFQLLEDLEEVETSPYELPGNISREERLNSVARATADLFLAGLTGNSDDMGELVDFLEECFYGFNPPLTTLESEFLYRKSIKAIKEREKL